MRRIVILAIAAFLAVSNALAEEGVWIRYPGDYEMWLGSDVQSRRIEHGTPCGVFWPEYSHWPQVTFEKEVNLEKPERIRVEACGDAYIQSPGMVFTDAEGYATIPAGNYTIQIRVKNAVKPPALKIGGPTVKTDKSWRVRWCPMESCQVATDENDCRMAYETVEPVKTEPDGKGGLIADFGRESMGILDYVVEGSGSFRIIYAESEEEAKAGTAADVWEEFNIPEENQESSHRTPFAMALRFVRFEVLSGNLKIKSVKLLREYLPIPYRGAFRCNDEEINRIWDVAAYTLHLTTREFFLDGIKRDRWVWSGDTRQSVNMAAYLFADNPVTRRTLTLLGGKDPIGAHVNTILDYTFFWIIAVDEYYMYSGDTEFVKQIWPRVKAYADWSLSRTDKDSFAVGRPGDWVFIDWAPGPMSLHGGAVSFQQVLFAESLRIAAQMAEVAGDEAKAKEYGKKSAELRAKIMPTFWNDERKALMHFKPENGEPAKELTRYANIFGIFLGYFDDAQKEAVVRNVLDNPDVMGIKTPYWQYYELESLCAIGRQETVLKRIKDYWGGMLKLGATSFWEEYDPRVEGVQHYAMYGRPFGKSLCHAWGASPVYLLPRYFLGVKPTKPGWEEYEVRPNLGGLEWMEGTIPTPFGEIRVKVHGNKIEVRSTGGKGTLIYPDGRRETILPQAASQE
ncbi:MAG: hypothetical protein IJQ31_03260 [Thermoguttaceae bacterium]|nr:hypothetical protein [Thermoguttaceae bacterium]